MQSAPLGEIAEIVSGATPKTRVDEYWDGDVQWATPADLSKLDGPYITTTQRRLTEAGIRSCATRVLPPGSVLLSSRAPIGHVAINTTPMATNQGFKSLVPRSCVDAKYLYHWLRSKTQYLQSLGNGATFKELSKKSTEQIEVPLPALPEQRRVAAMLDHADSLRAKHRQLLAHLDALELAVFREMFGGDYWRSVSANARGTNEFGWSWASLSDVTELATGHTPDRQCDKYWAEGSIPWISLPEIRALDGRIAMDTKAKVTEAGIAKSSAVLLPAGTVCFSRTASVGFVTTLGVPMATSQDFHNWIPGEHIDGGYLMSALRFSRAHLLGLSDGSIHRTIYQRTAQNLRILLPPLALQRLFEARRRHVSRLRSDAERTSATCEELFASLQSRAFRGEL